MGVSFITIEPRARREPVGTQVPEPTHFPSMARKLLRYMSMTLGIAILWICIGAAAGWFGSRIMGTFARPSALANIVIGITGAVLAGFISQRLLGANLGHAGVFVGLGGALFGSCLVIFFWQSFSRPSA